MTTPEPKKLEACPFCGHEAVITDDSAECGLPTFTLQCQGEECFFAMSEESEDVVVEMWNRRSCAPKDAEVALRNFYQAYENTGNWRDREDGGSVLVLSRGESRHLESLSDAVDKALSAKPSPVSEAREAGIALDWELWRHNKTSGKSGHHRIAGGLAKYVAETVARDAKAGSKQWSYEARLAAAERVK